MSILVDNDTRVVVQGITGGEGRFHTGQMIEYGTNVVAGAVPGRERERHPATRTFQAIRMQVNAELESLDAGLEAALDLLAPGGRLAVISFHSLEDRRVKQFMRRCADTGSGAQRDERGRPLPVVRSVTPTLHLVGKGQAPSDAEIEFNPRARSARLRVGERLP